MQRRGKTPEHKFNDRLGEFLKKIRPDWAGSINSEETGNLVEAAKRPDILIAPDSINPVGVESAYEDTSKVDQDAIDKLGLEIRGSGRIMTGAVIAIPQEIRHMNSGEIDEWLLAKNKFRYAAFSLAENGKHDRYPSGWGYLYGDAWDFATFVELSSTPDSRIKQVANKATETTILIADKLRDEKGLDKEELESLKWITREPTIQQAVRVAACTWLNAWMLHARMAEEGYITGGKRMKSPWKIGDIDELMEEWRKILEINHKSIFGIAKEAFEVVRDMRSQRTARIIFEDMKNAAREVCKLRIGPVGDIGAQIFPRLAAHQEATAAYYTRPEAAELLAGIAAAMLPEQRTYQVADPASGTGTLLKATYRNIRRKEKSLGTDPKALHKEYMEEHLFGADIQRVASHLTSSGLAGVNPSAPFDHDNIVCGSVENGGVGSLELLGNPCLDGVIGGRLRMDDESMDLVIMNPPYSVGGCKTKAFDHSGLSDESRLKSSSRVENLFKKNSRFTGSMRAGLALPFCALADKKLKTGGIFAFVLPMKAASGLSWKGFRMHLEANYDDVLVLGCREPFSEGTKINEILVCGRKRAAAKRTEHSDIRIATLKRRPKDFVEAHAIARVISGLRGKFGDIAIGEEKIGAFYTTQQRMGSPWQATGINIQLKRIAEELSFGYLLSPGMTEKQPICKVSALEKHGDIRFGPAHATMGYAEGSKAERGSFLFKKIRPNDRTNLCMWAADCSTQNTLYVKPTHTGVPRTGPGTNPNALLRETSSELFIAKDFSPPSQALAAAMTERKCLGGSAWNAIMLPKRTHAAYWLWLNSCFGLIMRWGRSDKNQKARMRFQIREIQNFPCPEFYRQEPRYEKMCQFANDFAETFKGKVLKPCSMAWVDPVRHELDAAAAEMLGLDVSDYDMETMRGMLCSSDQSMHGNKTDVLALLRRDGLLEE